MKMNINNELKFILNNQNVYSIDDTISKIIKLFEDVNWIDINEQLPTNKKQILAVNNEGLHLCEYRNELFIENYTLKIINNIKKWKLIV